jgi:alpha-L-fucosidase
MSTDIRFTTKDNDLFAYCMDSPTDDIRISSLGRNSNLIDSKVKSVKMLGSDEKLKWKQEPDALIIHKPAKLPDWKVIGFQVSFR